MLANIIVIAVVVILVAIACFSIHKANKSGKKCMGCSDGSCCGKKKCGCCEDSEKA